jgi:hypothetical protein
MVGIAAVPAYSMEQQHFDSHSMVETMAMVQGLFDRNNTNFHWTVDMDSFLHNAVMIHGHQNEGSWLMVSRYVCDNLMQSASRVNGAPFHGNIFDFISPIECQRRWNALRGNMGTSESLVSNNLHNHGSTTTEHSKNSNKASKNLEWSEEEKNKFLRLVDEALHSQTNFEYTKVITIGHDKMRTISWTNIAKAMNRPLEEVNYMWTKIRLTKFKHGAYSPEEDRLIITRVREWYSRPEEMRPKTGLWVALEKELNREDKRISERWRSILSKRVSFSVQESVASQSLLNAPSSSNAKRQRREICSHANSFDMQYSSNANNMVTCDSGIRPTFPSHPSIDVIENSHSSNIHHSHVDMQSVIENTNVPFEVLEKPESIRWNDGMVSRVL